MLDWSLARAVRTSRQLYRSGERRSAIEQQPQGQKGEQDVRQICVLADVEGGQVSVLSDGGA
jgi:hypothetical protein